MADETMIELVMRRLRIRSQVKLAALLGVNRAAPSDWKKRLGGKIPARHWEKLVDIGILRGVFFSFRDIFGDANKSS